MTQNFGSERGEQQGYALPPGATTLGTSRLISSAADAAASGLLEMSQSIPTSSSGSTSSPSYDESADRGKPLGYPQQSTAYSYEPKMVADAHEWDYYNQYYGSGAQRREEDDLEQDVCSDFVCCGQQLADLHALLQHYESSHVKVEDWDDRNYPAPAYGAVNPYSQEPAHSNRRMFAVGIERQESPLDAPSAFDTTVFRPIPSAPSHQHAPYTAPYSYQQSYPQQYPPNMPYPYPNNYMPVPKKARPITGSLASDFHAIEALRSVLPPHLIQDGADSSLRLIHNVLSSTLTPTPALGKRNSTSDGSSDDEESQDGQKTERPYVCNVPGCGKTYKNPNGLKYHMQHGHDKDGREGGEKPHRCPYPACAKRYKNPNGLKYHIQHHHAGNTPNGPIPAKPTVTSMKSLVGLTQIEAALKREQALRAQVAANMTRQP